MSYLPWHEKSTSAERFDQISQTFVCELCRLTVGTILRPVGSWIPVAPCLAHRNMGDSNLLSQMSATTETLCIYLLPIYLIDLPPAICLDMKQSTLAEWFDEISWIVVSSFRDLRWVEVLEIFVSLVHCWESLMCIIKQPLTNPTFIFDIQYLTQTNLCVSMHRLKTPDTSPNINKQNWLPQQILTRSWSKND